MLILENLSVALGNVPVLHRINLQVNDGEIFCLLGPSGCGKSTLLRTIAGLETAGSGSILFNGMRQNTIPTSRRGFGLMFQNYALFPHMTVEDNVAFGLKMAGHTSHEIRQRLSDVLSWVGLTEYAGRNVRALSGGQQQRVALARSIAPNPRLLMLDEPLASLDASLSRQLLSELRQIINQLGLTAIYVTHNQQEAFAIADRIGIMNAGRIEQIGTAQELYQSPTTVFVARFLGFENIVPIERFDNGKAVTPLGMFSVKSGSDAVLIHPDSIGLSDSGLPGDIIGRIVECQFQGQFYQLRVEVSDGSIFSFLLPAQSIQQPCKGDMINLHIDPGRVHGLTSQASGG